MFLPQAGLPRGFLHGFLMTMHTNPRRRVPASKLPHHQEPNSPSPRSQTKAPKPKISSQISKAKDPKPKNPRHKSQVKDLKPKIQSQRSQAKDLKPKIASQRSQATYPKPTISRPRSQTRDPKAKTQSYNIQANVSKRNFPNEFTELEFPD